MMDLGPLKERIKDTIVMDDVLARLNIELPPSRKIPSIYKDENTPSLHVYDQDFFDFSTGNGGDQVRFVQDYLKVGYGKALRWLAAQGSELAVPRRSKAPKQARDLTSLFTMEPKMGASSWQWEAAVELFKAWPVTLEFAELRYQVQVTRHGVWIPHFSGTRIVGIKTRRYEDGKKMSVKGSTFTESLYHSRQWGLTPDAVLVEGESDTWSLMAHLSMRGRFGVMVYGLPSGAGAWNDKFRGELLQHSRIYLALDGDEAGRRAAENIWTELSEAGNPPRALDVPGGRVAEALAAGWEPQFEEAEL